ncbi:ankyrin repeat domain-containing protein [Salipiger sp. P9]|uniref:ankyrin repeat domain-containing protein n=1 Tax=Salipiger pentaromativorans TaxID=2943193 RepID=UPI00215818FD|nr:ankyrin repeat domain-containing protein [Salipiger pentaromativorans]MCR8546752.1 ankyrin repeat domain-containing protein [Salipiger pentaromativorans]
MSEFSLESLRFDAKRLQRGFESGAPWALERLRAHPPRAVLSGLKRADFLQVVARENGFESWPRLKLAAETQGLDRAARVQRLKVALFHGQMRVAERLLDETPDLADGLFGLQCALYRREAVAAALAEEPALAVTRFGPRSPILHLAFSRWIHVRPELEADMLAVAELLLAHGADVNDGYPYREGDPHLLSALYGAIGHADNMVLARWLLAQGADPDDGESLYHATELSHHEGLRMLLEHGANPAGTNALLRALDFNDHAAVEMLVAHGARADDFDPDEVGGEAPWVIPALFQAARRGCDRRMAELLLDAGADPRRPWQGMAPYAYARACGSVALAEALAARGCAVALTPEEALLARAADGALQPGDALDPGAVPPACRGLLHEIAHRPERLPHMRALVALGMPFDAPGSQDGASPVQVAGWNGVPEVMGYFLSLGPDLGHINAYGGTLLSTILHGSENAPDRARRDHVACLELALRAGVALPRRAIRSAGREDVAAFLEDWAEAHPAQVV